MRAGGGVVVVEIGSGEVARRRGRAGRSGDGSGEMAAIDPTLGQSRPIAATTAAEAMMRIVLALLTEMVSGGMGKARETIVAVETGPIQSETIIGKITL